LPCNKQNDPSLSNDIPASKQHFLRGLAFIRPLNGVARGEGSGSAFAFGNVAAKSNIGGGISTTNGVSTGGGSGGGLGYVETAIGSAYGGGNGGGNVTSIKSEYGMSEGASTYAMKGAEANSTFSGQAYGAGRGKGTFGGLFKFTLNPQYYYTSDRGPTDLSNFGNKTGGGGSGVADTDVVTEGYVETIPFLGGYAGTTGSVASAAAGYGYGGGSLVIGNKTTSAGGAGGGDVLADALGYAFAGNGQVVTEAEFNATGDAFADGGAYGYVGDKKEEPQP
jgi:hypothetical protein